MQFKVLDLRAQYQQIKPEIDAAVARVFESQYFILSPDVAAFEKELAEATLTTRTAYTSEVTPLWENVQDSVWVHDFG